MSESMHDNDVAYNTQPVDGEMSTLSEATMNGAQVDAYPARMRVGEAHPLRRILVVEDDASLASLEAGVLAAHGYVVAIASSGELAITVLQQALPDLVLLDLDLSGTITGWDVLKVLRSYSRAPVLLTSAESAVRKHIRTHGETRSTLDHLPKPYPMQTLLKRIERMLAIAP